jgi:hypothetical protein
LTATSNRFTIRHMSNDMTDELNPNAKMKKKMLLLLL